MAESMVELKSMMSPFLSSLPGSTSSVPVGMIETTGLRRTMTVAWPLASIAAMSTGRITWFSEMISSVATMSSPTRRTCCHGVAGFRISISDSDIFSTSSIMITAFIPSGMGSPVSIADAWEGAWSRFGLVSEAPKVSMNRTAYAVHGSGMVKRRGYLRDHCLGRDAAERIAHGYALARKGRADGGGFQRFMIFPNRISERLVVEIFFLFECHIGLV